MKMLDDQGVKKIESIGKPFDVNFHEAMMQQKQMILFLHILLLMKLKADIFIRIELSGILK